MDELSKGPGAIAESIRHLITGISTNENYSLRQLTPEQIAQLPEPEKKVYDNLTQIAAHRKEPAVVNRQGNFLELTLKDHFSPNDSLSSGKQLEVLTKFILPPTPPSAR